MNIIMNIIGVNADTEVTVKVDDEMAWVLLNEDTAGLVAFGASSIEALAAIRDVARRLLVACEEQLADLRDAARTQVTHPNTKGQARQ